MEEVPGSEKFFPAQLVFLALGFLGPENEVIKALGLKQDARSNIQTSQKVRVTGYSLSMGSWQTMSARSTLRTLRAFSLPETVVVVSH